MRWLRALALCVLLLAPGGALAVQPDEMLADPDLEARARALSRDLRCMVCQNQSIDDSDAPLARDLRLLVRERIKAGDSDDKVLDFLVARYGEFVLLKPRFESHTALLWLTPLGVLALGALAMLLGRRRMRRGDSDAPIAAADRLTSDEEARIAELTGPPAGAPQ